MTDSRDDEDELADTVESLSTELQSLRDELKREAPRGPLGLPRPPSPREFLEFADEVAIPGTIAILEANIKLLETLQRAIRLADSSRRARDRAGDARSRAADSADRLASVSDDTLERLEGSLTDLQTALQSGPLPDDETARDLVEEARSLRDDVRLRLRESRERDHTLDDFEERADRADRERRANAADGDGQQASGDDDGGSTGDTGGGGDGTDSRGVKVDVDAELETLKDRYGEGDDPAAATDGEGGDDDPDATGAAGGNESDADDEEPSGDGPSGDGPSDGDDGASR